MTSDDAGTVRKSPEGKIAVRMGPGVSAGAYFVLDPNNGGFYSDGSKETIGTETDVADWAVLAE